MKPSKEPELAFAVKVDGKGYAFLLGNRRHSSVHFTNDASKAKHYNGNTAAHTLQFCRLRGMVANIVNV